VPAPAALVVHTIPQMHSAWLPTGRALRLRSHAADLRGQSTAVACKGAAIVKRPGATRHTGPLAEDVNNVLGRLGLPRYRSGSTRCRAPRGCHWSSLLQLSVSGAHPLASQRLDGPISGRDRAKRRYRRALADLRQAASTGAGPRVQTSSSGQPGRLAADTRGLPTTSRVAHSRGSSQERLGLAAG
jgi:hypothetical protein